RITNYQSQKSESDVNKRKRQIIFLVFNKNEIIRIYPVESDNNAAENERRKNIRPGGKHKRMKYVECSFVKIIDGRRPDDYGSDKNVWNQVISFQSIAQTQFKT